MYSVINALTTQYGATCDYTLGADILVSTRVAGQAHKCITLTFDPWTSAFFDWPRPPHPLVTIGLLLLEPSVSDSKSSLGEGLSLAGESLWDLVFLSPGSNVHFQVQSFSGCLTALVHTCAYLIRVDTQEI